MAPKKQVNMFSDTQTSVKTREIGESAPKLNDLIFPVFDKEEGKKCQFFPDALSCLRP